MAYDIAQVTSVYDTLTAKVKTDLDAQFNAGRLKGSDYSNVYSKLMSECLQLAFEAPLKAEQILSIEKDIALKDEEMSTQVRQRQGFDDNMRLKLMETQLNAWAMMFSSGMLPTSPAMITNDEATTLYNSLKTELGI